MGMPAFLLQVLCRAAQDQNGGAACAAGYPDLLVTGEQLTQALGAERARGIPVRTDSANIIAWHNVGSWLDRIYDTTSVFRTLGYTLDVLDINASRGDEILVDLNVPLPADFGRSYDLVLDTGTCEHCFHIGQAAMNLASLVKAQGIIIQALPLNSFNHGFYNINPTWFFDFYPDNGFEILYYTGVSQIVARPRLFDPPPFERFGEAPERSMSIVVARRTRVMPLAPPMQRKYREHPGLGND